jgi:nicotinate phosphoribosyltransferase
MIPPQVELFADLYELRMARAYRALGMEGEAVFSLFVRRLPPGRNLLVACGVEDLLDVLEGWRFGPDSLAFLRGLEPWPEEFLAWLSGLRFSGSVRAVPEGTPVFAEEPLLEIAAPIAEAQLLETLAMAIVGAQTLFASKAFRVVQAAAGRPVVEFGSRRAQGLDSAVAASRAFALAGVSGTSNLLSASRHGIPAAGTVAHAFIQAFEREADAFRAFARLYPDTVLLVDSYDTLRGVARVVELARELGPDFRVSGVRLDSGDLLTLSVEARRMLDAAGLERVRIFASGGLDEREVARLIAAGAPVDAFGVGTEMSVSGDAPALDLAYKLVAYAGVGRTKLSAGKRILPGAKQVFRGPEGDVIGLAGELLPGQPLLEPMMAGGRRLAPRGDWREGRARLAAAVASLPARLLSLDPADPPWPVALSPALAAAWEAARARAAAA